VGKTGVADDPPERLVHGVGVEGLALAVGEHPRFLRFDAGRGELGGLEGLPAVEDGQGGGVQVDAAAGCLGLASGLVELVADGDEPAFEVEPLLGEVDVGPLEAEDLFARIPDMAVSQ
jgi:hypothetical protein